MLLYPAKGDPAGPISSGAKPIHRRRGHRFPLIVFSHGYLASGPAYATVLARFVSRGYVVAAPTFPLSSGGAPGGPKGGDYVNQPADVSFVLSKVLRLTRGHHGLTRTIDRHEIGVAGHSLGAITTLGVAGWRRSSTPQATSSTASSRASAGRFAGWQQTAMSPEPPRCSRTSDPRRNTRPPPLPADRVPNHRQPRDRPPASGRR